MPIQTRGFGVDVMPQYTPVDPNVVAFNPTAISEGASTAFQLARMYDELKAKRALMQELEATRRSRIEAQNIANNASVAQNLSNMRVLPARELYDTTRLGTETGLVPQRGNLESLKIGAESGLVSPRAGLEGLQIGEQIKTVPIAGQATRAGALTDIARQEGTLGNMGEIMQAQKAGARAQTAEAGTVIDTAADKTAFLNKEFQSKAADLAAQDQLRQKKVMAAEQDLNDKIINGATSAELDRAYKKAQTVKLESEAEMDKAHAKFYEESLSAKKDPNEKIGDLQLAIQRARAQTYTLPDNTKGNLAVYYGETRDSNGNIKTSRFHHPGWANQEVRLDPAAEAAIGAEKFYNATIRRILEENGQKADKKNPSPDSVTPPAAKNTLPTITTKAQYDALPDGAPFIGGDGKQYTKPKKTK